MACNCERKRQLLSKITGYDPLDIIYMDYNATTPVLKEAIAAFESSCRNMWANPSSFHNAGVKAWQSLENCRINISEYFGVDHEHIYFSSSGSESIFTGIRGLYAEHENSFFITTTIEHSSVLKNIAELPRHRILILPVNEEGRVDLTALSTAIEKNRNKKIIFVYSPVNHETGGIQPVKEIYSKINQNRGIVFLDAVQAVPRLPVKDWIEYCDMFAMSSHKIYSVKGSGILYKPDRIKIKASRWGGKQENGLFPGTENTPGIAAMSESFSFLKNNFTEEYKRIKILTAEGISILQSLPYEINLESPVLRVPGVLCLSFPEIYDIEDFLSCLIHNNFCLSRFSACSDNVKGISQVLTAMGRPERRSEKSLRISLGINSKREDFYRLAEVIKDYYRTMRKLN